MTADDYLRLAIHTGSPAAAGAYAMKGLRDAQNRIDPETTLLLLREIYRSHFYAGRLRSAHAIARKMVRLGVALEIAHVDLGRVCLALGWWLRASQAYRIAARNAPARRRAMHWSSVAIALHHGGDADGALSALERAIRWSLNTRPLHRAYMALVHIDAGEAPESVEGITEAIDELEVARCGEGFGRYVLGLLHAARGDDRRARAHLRIFVKRNADDPMRASTLGNELRRARATLRTIRARSPSRPPPATP
jgi:tetratricopeptide (TPR) repeat protein